MAVWSPRNFSWPVNTHKGKRQLQSYWKEYLSDQLVKRNFGFDFRERRTKIGWESGEYIYFYFKRISFNEESYSGNTQAMLCLLSQHLFLQSRELKHMASGSKQQVEKISHQMKGPNTSSDSVRPLRRLVTSAQDVNEAAENWSTSLLEYESWSVTEEGKKCLASLGQVNYMEDTNAQGTVLEGGGTQSKEVMIDMNINTGNRKRLRNEVITEGVENSSKDQEDEIMVATNSNASAEMGFTLQ